MSLKDYAHWNEDAYYMWWNEEGRFPSEPPEYDDDYDREDCYREEETEVNCPHCGYDVIINLYDYEVSSTPCPSCNAKLSIDAEV